MEKKLSKIEWAREIIERINRKNDGLSIEQAGKLLFENYSKLSLRYGKEADDVFKEYFCKFYERYPKMDELSAQFVLCGIIAEEEHVDITNVFSFFTGIKCLAEVYRNFLEEKGIKTGKNHDDCSDCYTIGTYLWKEINEYRIKNGIIALHNHFDHSEHAISHSEEMANQGKVFESISYYFFCDGFLAEDVVKANFCVSVSNLAAEIFKEICKKDNVLNPSFTGVGIGLWKKEGIIYATLRYSVICEPKCEVEEQ